MICSALSKPHQSTKMSKNGKILVRRVIHRGHTFGLSLVEITDEDVKISPFEHETSATRFVDGTIRILREGYKSKSDWHVAGDNPVLIIE